MSFGRIVRKRRKEKGYSLRKLAGMLEVSAGYLSRIEKNQVPPPAEGLVKRIAAHLDLNADELLARADKVSDDLLAIIKNDPIRIADVIRSSATSSVGFSYPPITKKDPLK